MNKVWLLAVFVIFVSACAVQPEQVAATGPASVLMAKADEEIAAGDNARAMALLERAVRIEPNNGHAWLRLAKQYMVEGNLSKAEQFARRALQLSGSDATLERESQELIKQLQKRQQEQS